MSISSAEIRKKVFEVILGKYSEVKDCSSGTGVPKYSRLEWKMGSEVKKAVVKLSSLNSKGRISFPEKDDGSFSVLHEVDFVIYARPLSDDAVSVHLYDQADILEAFQVSRAALQAEGGKSGFQIWLSPEKEKATRFAGSGYISKAIWIEDVKLSEAVKPVEIQDHDVSEVPNAESKGKFLEAKQIVANALGVSIEQVEIEVRVKG